MYVLFISKLILLYRGMKYSQNYNVCSNNSVLGENVPDMYKREIISVILIQIHIFIKII